MASASRAGRTFFDWLQPSSAARQHKDALKETMKKAIIAALDTVENQGGAKHS